MGLKMDKFKKKKPNTDGPEITWTRTMMDQNNYGLFGIFFFFMDLFFWSIIFQKTVIKNGRKYSTKNEEIVFAVSWTYIFRKVFEKRKKKKKKKKRERFL